MGIENLSNQNNLYKKEVLPSMSGTQPSAAQSKKAEIALQGRDANLIHELQELGLKNVNGQGEKITINGKTYVIIGEATNGRRIVQDPAGNFQVIAHDNTLLKTNYVKTQNKKELSNKNDKALANATIKMLDKSLSNAQAAFEQQMADDGWAGDLADGVSILWASDNRATKVKEDLAKYQKSLTTLKKAAEQSNDAFKLAFKNMFGVEYNKQAILNFMKNSSSENYTKAFGENNNIVTRVQNYNQSQQQGANVIKTGTTVVGGVAIGVVTGGVGLAALGTAAAATTGLSASINYSDRLSSDTGLKEGEFTSIGKQALIEGASTLVGGAVARTASSLAFGTGKTLLATKAAMNIAGDVGVGAAQEYLETGEVSVEGTLTNTAFSSFGSAAELGAFKKANTYIKKMFSSTADDVAPVNNLVDINGNQVSGGWFTKKNKPITLASSNKWEQVKTNAGKMSLMNSDGKLLVVNEGDKFPKPVELKPNESKILGYTDDGKSIVATLESDKIVVNYIENNANSPEVKSSKNTFSQLFHKKEKPISTAMDNPLSDANVRDNLDFVTNTNRGTSKVSNALETARKDSPTKVVDFSSKNIDLNNLQGIPEGKVFTHNSKLYVNDAGQALELKMSQETFERLFPPEGFAAIKQQGRNNCWLVSRLISMTESSSGRAHLYSMLEERPNGDIVVNLKGRGVQPVVFPHGEAVEVSSAKLGNGASSGVEMIEQAVLVKMLKKAEGPVSDVSQLTFSDLNNVTSELKYSDINGTKYLLGSARSSKSSPDEIRQIMQDFKNGEDMCTLSWMAHQRSVVGYDSVTDILTYHDPMYQGVDMQCSLSDMLMKENPSFMMYKAKPVQARNMSPTPTPVLKQTPTPTPAPKQTLTPMATPQKNINTQSIIIKKAESNNTSNGLNQFSNLANTDTQGFMVKKSKTNNVSNGVNQSYSQSNNYNLPPEYEFAGMDLRGRPKFIKNGRTYILDTQSGRLKQLMI